VSGAGSGRLAAGGRVLFLGFEGTALTAAERRMVERVRPAGFTLVPRNVADERQLEALVAELRRAAPGALLALDGEGGRVDRLRGLVGPAPAGERLARRPPALARRAGRWVGETLRRFGFDLDLAPVVDLDRGRANNALDGRCLGGSPRPVIARARAFVEGLESAGVGACLKHFPGLGGAGADTHVAPSLVDLPRAELVRDLLPFRALAARTGAVMVAHAVYPALDPERLPATLSPAIVTALLRGDLAFEGVALSDDLEMGALAPHGDLPERAERALAAGCDGLLFCRQLEEAPAIAARLARPRLSARLEQAARRLDRLARALRRRARAAGPGVPVERLRARLAALARAVGAEPERTG
jgi:beta-N-acetylhexosaminidase